MAIETVEVHLQVPKEAKEVIDAAMAVAAHFLQKKSLAEAMELLPALAKAAEGAGSVLEEARSKYRDEIAAYGVHKLWETFDKGAVSEPEAAPVSPTEAPAAQ